MQVALGKQGWIRWTAIYGAWFLLGLFISSQNYVLRAAMNRPISVLHAIAMGLGHCLLWALATPLILFLIRRFKLERPLWLRHLLVHILASLVLSNSINIAHSFLMYQFFPPPGAAKFALSSAMSQTFAYFDYWLLIYWVILLVIHATEFYSRYEEKELKATQLESQLAQAQLTALRTQLNPHFLFNTLHAISALMYRDVGAANRMVAQLSDLLRLTLEMGGAQEVPLKQELDFLDRYLEIQRARFSDRLTVQFHVDPESLDALVPNFVLQPLVENAIRHGIAPRIAPGLITIIAKREGPDVLLEVKDNGAGFPANWSPRYREGVGLRNTRARLQHMYGARHRFDLWNASEGGAVATVVVPFNPAEVAGPEVAARQRRPAPEEPIEEVDSVFAEFDEGDPRKAEIAVMPRRVVRAGS
jgi:signal transduction histidine kinase